jgi:DNA-binding response OmpR family regulator
MTTILLVEDEAALAQLIVQGLEKHGYLVLNASDGQSALHLYAQYQPDLILLDWVIAVLDGQEVLHRLRQISATPVLMLAAQNWELDPTGDRMTALGLSADETITKPFSISELDARVRAHLRRVERMRNIVSADREKQARCLAYQDLNLDPSQRRLTVAGQSVELTSLEFDLLYLLLRNPGRVFSRSYLSEIMELAEEARGGGIVDEAIHCLRNKLGTPGVQIETVEGIGYRLIPG